MNLKKIFEAQAQLDEHIIQEHPELRGQDNLDWKVLALQVELGELANEWRGFKKWSNDQEPRTTGKCAQCLGLGKSYFSGNVYTGRPEVCTHCDGTGQNVDKNPLLEEYVDCLHFILSIGLELGYTGFDELDINEHLATIKEGSKDEITSCFIVINYISSGLTLSMVRYEQVLCEILALGVRLGLALDQIENAYYAKNKTNHKRQEDGY